MVSDNQSILSLDVEAGVEDIAFLVEEGCREVEVNNLVTPQLEALIVKAGK